MNKFYFVVAAVVGSLSVGCAADSSRDDDEPTQEELDNAESALQGGCSMGEIRGWQGICRDSCGGRSRGIHYCFPGMSMFHAGHGGTCACY